MKLLKLQRSLDIDVIAFMLFGFSFVLSFRPIRLMKYFYWGVFDKGHSKRFRIQCPWLTISVIQAENKIIYY